MREAARRLVRFALLLSLLALIGCAAPAAPRPPTAGATYVLHLPGVAGETPIDHWWLDALRQGGVGDRLEVYDWTCNDRGLGALRAIERNHAQAQAITGRIVAQRRADPSGRVILTAVSGGTGVAVWALERLPPGVRVDAVVLVAPAFAPDYDLSAALRHVQVNAYAFTSSADVVVLGLGTRLFGTIDRKNTDAAGLVGLHVPSNADLVAYRKLKEMRYRPEWLRWGNFGDHTGAMSVTFARDYLAPILIEHLATTHAACSG